MAVGTGAWWLGSAGVAGAGAGAAPASGRRSARRAAGRCAAPLGRDPGAGPARRGAPASSTCPPPSRSTRTCWPCWPRPGRRRARPRQPLPGGRSQRAGSVGAVRDGRQRQHAGGQQLGLAEQLRRPCLSRPALLHRGAQRAHGLFYGVGLTTGIPGHFIAAPVRGQGGDVIGVVAVKVSLDSIEAAWDAAREPILLYRRSAASSSSATCRTGSTATTRPLTRWAGMAALLPAVRRPHPVRAGALALERGDGRGRLCAAHRRSPASAQLPGPRRGAARVRLDADRHWPTIAPIAQARRNAWALSALAAAGAAAGRRCTGASASAGCRAAPGRRRAGTARAASARASCRTRTPTARRWRIRCWWACAPATSRAASSTSTRRCARCSATRAEELVGRMPPYPYWHPDDLDKHWRDNEAVVTGKAALNGFESRVRHRDGHDVYTMVYTAPLIDGQRQAERLDELGGGHQRAEAGRGAPARAAGAAAEGDAPAQPGRDGLDAGARAEPAADGAVQLCRRGAGLCRAGPAASCWSAAWTTSARRRSVPARSSRASAASCASAPRASEPCR